MNNIKNYGVIEGQRPEDYKAGLVAGVLPYEERLPSGDWTPFLPKGEWQKNNYVDTMACVTFSALNSLEAQYKFLTGEDRNFSDRFTAKMSDTSINGNYLWRVGDSIRHDGLVDEELWPAPINYSWDSYYSDVFEGVKEEGKRFLDEWDVKYEWVDTDKASLIKHLKQSPIQVVIPGHAIMNFNTTQDVIHYFDSYEPFFKTTQNIMWAFKYVLTPKNKTMTQEEVRRLYVLAFYREPDAGELSYWTGKPLADFLKIAIKDRSEFLAKEVAE